MCLKIVTFCALFALFQTINGQNKFLSSVPHVGITNGDDAKENQFPHHALLSLKFGTVGTGYCSGSLISKSKILTAAQCVKAEIDNNGNEMKVTEVAVLLGCIKLPCNNKPITVEGGDVLIHPDFERKSFKGDLAIITLPDSVSTSKSINTISLDYDSKSHEGEKATISGWGKTKDSDPNDYISGTLKYVETKVISNTECAKKLPIKDYHICTAAADENNKHKGICRGDGGGALVAGDKQIGVASFSYKSCEDISYPSGYTRVSEYADWLKKNSSYQIVASNVLLAVVSFVILLRNSF